jgi:hypothetical protein
MLAGGVAHAFNPSYLGGRDQEDQGSRFCLGKKKFKRSPSQSIMWE